VSDFASFRYRGWLACADAAEPDPNLKITPRRDGRWELRLINRRGSRNHPLLAPPRADAKAYILGHKRWPI
jgi:hypothetical protein